MQLGRDTPLHAHPTTYLQAHPTTPPQKRQLRATAWPGLQDCMAKHKPF